MSDPVTDTMLDAVASLEDAGAAIRELRNNLAIVCALIEQIDHDLMRVTGAYAGTPIARELVAIQRSIAKTMVTAFSAS